MRKRFLEELESLKIALIKMGGMCEDAMDALKAMMQEHFNEDAYEKIRQLEEMSDEEEKKIESMCLKLIFSQQPVARDLRFISSVLKMISDLERISDQVLDIAHLLKESNNMQGMKYISLDEMVNATSKMVKDSVESFVRRDVTLAKEVLHYDGNVDQLFNKVKEEVIDEIVRHKEQGASLVDVLMIAKYLERIGDHSVNIAEWVLFAVGDE